MSTLTTMIQDLVYDIVTDKEGNFVCFGEGMFHRLYLFCLKHRTKNDIENYVLFKVQRDEYSILPPQNIYNPHIDQLWLEEYKNLSKLKKASHIVQIKEILREEEYEIGEKSEGKEVPLHFSPMCYCQDHRIFFHLPCPTCGGVMKTCDLDTFQKIHSTSLGRYIYCPSPNCKDPGNKKTRIYYNTVGTALHQTNSNSLKELSSFFFIGRETLLDILLKNTKNFTFKSPLAANIPCLQCKKKDIFGNCPYFRIFSFYEFYAIPLEICHFPFDSLLQIISGRKLEETKKELLEKKWYFLLKDRESAEETTQEKEYFSFNFNNNIQDRGLEILYLKLKLFVDICHSVQKIHKSLGIAQMNFVHDSIMVVQEKIEDIIEGHYRLGLFFSGFSSAKLGLMPQYNLCMPYSISPMLKEKIEHLQNPQYQNWGELSLENQIFQVKPEKIRVAMPYFFSGDYIEWFYKDDKERRVNLGVIRSIKENENTLEGKILTEQSQSIKNCRVLFRHYPHLGAQEDIYSLGKLFLYILFFNQKNNLMEIEKWVQDAENYLAVCPLAMSASELEKKILAFQNSDLQQKNIFYDIQHTMNAHSSQNTNNIIPKPIWDKVMILIFRMITTRYINFSLIHQEKESFTQKIIQNVKEILELIQDKLFKRVSFYDLTNTENFERSLLDELKQDMQILSESQITRTFSARSQDNRFMYSPNTTGIWDNTYSLSQVPWWKKWWKK
mgnify:CR=1 FL=1